MVDQVILHAQGGRGDVINAEPVFRYTINHVLAEEDLIITSDHPDLFEHLRTDRVQVFLHHDFVKRIDEFKDWKTLCAYQNKTRPGRGIMQPPVHGVDFASLYLLGYIIPPEHRRVMIPGITEEEALAVRQKFYDDFQIDIKETLLIHPGWTWPTRTIPKEWWERFLAVYDKPVCVVGQASTGVSFKTNEGTTGYAPGVIHLDGVNRWVDGLTVRGLIVAISQAWGIITNDSFPVHIAGAYDNYLFTFSTVKYWEALKPYGHDKSYNFSQVVVPPSMYAASRDEIRFDLMPEGANIMDYLDPPEAVAEYIRCLHFMDRNPYV